MASLGSYLPEAGSAVWRRDRASEPGAGSAQEGNKVRHVVIRDAEIRNSPSNHVVYKVDVLTEQDHWYMYRRYSEFHALHKKLVKGCGLSWELLPPKRFAGNLSKALIDLRRQLLEQYLQKLIHSEPQIAQSDHLLLFLDVPTHDVVKVADVLTRYLYHHGDKLLEDETPIALSVNEMYSITRRLQLPQTSDGTEVEADPAHLYSFIHQLQRLRVSPPPPASSVCCSPFELAPFRSLTSLKIDHVPISQVCGLTSLQQQLRKLTVHRSLHSLRELLISTVEEHRGSVSSSSPPPPSSPSPSSSSASSSPQHRQKDGWRLTATARLTNSRVVVQPWHQLHTLTLTHNLITHLDDSLQLLPSLTELVLSHNKLQLLKLKFLCLPSLEKLILSHNNISKIQDDKKVLERIAFLNLSHNQLSSLDGLTAFVGVCSLDLSYNLLGSHSELQRLLRLRRVTSLSLTGNPLMATQPSRLVVLANFLHRSREVSLDGSGASPKEKAKIRALKDKYGTDPDLWPIAKTTVAMPTKAPPTASEEDVSSDDSPPLEVSWQIQTPSTPSQDHTPTPHTLNPHHSQMTWGKQRKQEQPEEEQFSVGAWQSREGSLVSLPSRDSPDGQSDQDIRRTSPDLSRDQGPPSGPVLATPPSTPLTTNGNYKPTVTPLMIRSALEALQNIEDKDTPISMTPCEEPMLPEAVTSALTAWISSQNISSSVTATPLTSPPPSTPLEGSGEAQTVGISASDLITALSSLMGDATTVTSGESSGACSVPQATPQEGFPEWARLGIRPEEVIQALSALTITDEGESLTTITEEEGGAMAASISRDKTTPPDWEDGLTSISKEEAVNPPEDIPQNSAIEDSIATEEDYVSLDSQSVSSAGESDNEHRSSAQPVAQPLGPPEPVEDSVLYS